MYALRVLLFIFGARRERGRPLPTLREGYQPYVSVIVPARNEEANIAPCVRSIMACRGVRDRCELIVVNDRSTDGTAAVLKELCGEFPGLIVHNTAAVEVEANLKGKPRALHEGILRSQGEILLMTDADCTVEPDWIEYSRRLYHDPATAMVASFTVIEPQKIFDTLQALEWMFNHTMASAGVGLRQPLGCFGNNLSIRRSLYDELGGFAGIPFSVTEDLALLQAVARSGRQIRYPCHAGLKVATLPAENWMTFIRQHQRWAKGGQALGWRATIFVISSAAIWLAAITALASGAWIFLLGVLAFRILSDTLLLWPSLRELGFRRLAPWLLLAVPFFMLLELVIPFFLLPRSVKWKGQVFR